MDITKSDCEMWKDNSLIYEFIKKKSGVHVLLFFMMIPQWTKFEENK